MTKYKIGMDFGGTGYTKNDASLWLLIKTLWIFLRYDNNPPVMMIIEKEASDDKK